MPYSEDQRKAAAIALHNPSKLYKRNRSLLKASKDDLRDLSSGPVKKKKRFIDK
jgi:hypothetical protein